MPRETSLQENRIGLTPEAVQHLVNEGHEVIMEAGAGEPSKYADHAYSEAGAQIAYSTEEVFKADVLLKVAPPTLEEIELLHPGQTLISALQMGSMTQEYIAALTRKKINAIGFELMKDPSGARPVVRAMSEIAGSTVMLIAAEYLARSNEGKGIILGGITGVPPSQVVILGAGTVAEYAARAATDIVGKANLDTEVDPSMAGEDFSYMLQQRPGAFIFIGNGDTAGLHNPSYDFSDEAIGYGISYWAKLAEQRLGS